MAVNFSLTALTGINSASTGLGVISNNISNAQTVGFKSSRAEFADLFYGTQNSPGTGSRTQTVHQNFSQGAINDTGNALDLAISGEGMFVLSDATGRYSAVYTRNGSFKLDKDGYISDQAGNKLQGFSQDPDTSTATSAKFKTILEPMNIGALNKTPKATTAVDFDMNLNGQDPVSYTLTPNGGKQSTSGVPFNANSLKDLSYDGAPNYSTTKDVYDSLGGKHRMTVNYYKAEVNGPGDYPTSNGSANNTINYTQETTDWYAQYIMEDYDAATNTYYKSGSGQESGANGTSNTTAMTAYQALVALPATTTADADAKTAMNAVSTFGKPTTPQGAANAAYDMAMSLGGTTTQATAARDAAWTGAGATGSYPVDATTPSAFTSAATAFKAATAILSPSLLTAADKIRLDTGYTSYATTPWGADSGRLATLFTVTNAAGVQVQPNTAAQAGQAASAAATKMGLTASQAALAATAAQNAFTTAAALPAYAAAVTAYNTAVTAYNAAVTGGVAATIATAADAKTAAAAAMSLITNQPSFDAAFGSTGVTTSIPDAVVQAYRFDNTGKLLDFNNSGDFAMMSGNTTPPTIISAPQDWYFDVPNKSGTVGVTEAMTFSADLTKFTQYAGNYTLRGVTQDGYSAGDLVGVQVNKDGSIEAQYSNGRSNTVAQLAIANFSDQQGMSKLGSQMWAESAASGPRSLGTPQASGFGTIQAGALEYSNVDVTGELVNMIFMQKMYQASAQVISTDKTLTQTILQL